MKLSAFWRGVLSIFDISGSLPRYKEAKFIRDDREALLADANALRLDYLRGSLSYWQDIANSANLEEDKELALRMIGFIERCISRVENNKTIRVKQ